MKSIYKYGTLTNETDTTFSDFYMISTQFVLVP